MHRSVKYPLKPTKGQAVRLDHLLWMQRNLYNEALKERSAAWRLDGRSVSKFDQFAALNGMNKTRPELGQYGTVVARGTLTRLDESFQGFYRRCRSGNTPGYPRYKSRTRWNSVSYPQSIGWKLYPDAGRLHLMGVGHVKVNLHRPLPGRPKVAIIKREGRRWWVVILCDRVPNKLLTKTGRQIGLDLGVASILTTSDGEHLANPRFAHRAAQRLAVAHRDLADKKRGSNRKRKAAHRVGVKHRKVANCRRDLAHQTSRRMVNSFDLIVHEALRIADMTHKPLPRPDGQGGWERNGRASKRGLNRSIHDAGWGQLLRFIAYKAEEAGREVIAVDPRNTSRTCSACGYCEKANRPTQAKFICLSCGYVAHADENAAVNILRAGLALRDAAQAAERGTECVAPNPCKFA